MTSFPRHPSATDRRRPAQRPSSSASPRRALAAVIAGAIALAATPGQAQQNPVVYTFCYVPNSGVVYRVDGPQLPSTCSSDKHVRFSFTEGLSGHLHAALNGLDADDHPQYLLVDPATRALIENLNADDNKIVGLAAATANGEAVRFEQAVKAGDAAGGDLSGDYPNPTVVMLQGNPVADTEPTEDQVLAWDGTQWIPVTPASVVASHAGLTGLEKDDHEQYLLTDGVRDATDGFAVTGTFDTGAIPAEGDGVRLMWYPGKAAFRAGRVWGGSSHMWDDANVGSYSTAFGQNTIASGTNSFAIGHGSVASGGDSFAAGFVSSASGARSVAMGFRASTTDPSGTARHGVFVFADNFSLAPTRPTNNQQAVFRAFNGIRLFNSHGDSHFTFEGDGTGTGCRILGGNLTCTGAITQSSDVSRKSDFEDVDPEHVLSRLAAMPVREWSYREDGPGIRHVGPTAQDFHAAFGLGQDDRTISSVDASGINMLAIQAIERRTRTLSERTSELDALRSAFRSLDAAHQALAARHDELQRRVAALEALLPSPDGARDADGGQDAGGAQDADRRPAQR